MVRKISKDAGVSEPTAEEKDPAFLALQVRSLIGTVNNLVQVQQQNAQELLAALAMNDVNQQVMQRMLKDVAKLVAVAGNTGDLKVNPDRSLDIAAYYSEYRIVGEAAGPRDADLAVILWSRGSNPGEAVAHAKLQNDELARKGQQPADPNYEDQFFGGNNGQSRNEQIA